MGSWTEPEYALEQSSDNDLDSEQHFMSIPLNLNLIIPFKDNKEQQLNLYRNEIEVFKNNLAKRVDELKDEIFDLFGDSFELSIAARSDGHTKKYFWRFKSSKRDRKYNRLYTQSVIDYIKLLDDPRRLRIKEIEGELILINANLKLVKGMLDSIDQSVKEQEVLLNTVF